MAQPEEGLEIVDVRTIWPHEALNFTPWLANNLDLLGKELGIKLELVQMEKQVGPLSLDILAKEADKGVMVAIENQLEWTDTLHLGQLLTYATGCDAQVAIWVAPEFRHEYAEALHRLNQWTREDIQFYGVKIDAVKHAPDSCPEPRFRKVVYPGGWNKEITLPTDPPMSPVVQKFHDFFQPLIRKLIQTGFAEKAVQYFSYTGRFFPSRIHQGLGYAASLEGNNSAWVTFNIRMEVREKTKQIFDALLADQEQIEASIDADPKPAWTWFRYDTYDFSSISIRKDGSIDDPPDKLEETRAWMLDLLPRLKEVFDPRVEKILK